ncbi:MAG: starch-binding protein [Ruminococcus sp.]|nr:starch-binding protein [Ruminococcus sp.]
MKKKGIKVLGLFLAVVMVLSCCAVAGLSVSAATGDVVYFDNSVTHFSTVNCYMWYDGTENNNGSWPGKPMTNVSGDIWAYNIDGDYDKIIFNDGGTQSDDLNYPGNGQIAKPNGNGNKFGVSWSAYSGDTTLPTSATTPTSGGSSSGGSSSGSYSIYCQNDAGWSSVYCYMWNSGTDTNGSWPGVPMTSLGDGVWEYNYSKQYANVIFNGGSDANKTGDLTTPSVTSIYNNSSNSWEPYSSSPVKITSFTSSIQSPAYTNCSIKLTTVAKSAAGSLYYKYTVNGPTGESVLSNSAASSVTWIPTVVGTYKVTVEVTDTAGNSNSRSLDFVINDPSLLETAFISAFSNSLGTNTQIKQNTNITFTLTALGGHTGNNLLFYKFIIVDPNGGTNTPYYTTSNTYSYTPTKLGVYTIQAYVQNSYNDTVNGTYTYTCVGDISETPEDTSPAPVQPTTSAATESTTAPTESVPGGVTPQPTTPSSATDAPSESVTTPSQKTERGDVNGDGVVDVIDVTTLQKHLASVYVPTFIESQADTNRDGAINIKDATRIQEYLVGLVSQI